jgi:ABC-type phosphate transport system permease subunit
MKISYSQCPASIKRLAFFELLGVLSCVGLLFFTTNDTRDFIALLIGALVGIAVVYGLWTVQFWAFWLTAAYELTEIIYELFLTTLPAYKDIHLAGPIFGILMSAITLAYIFLDRSVKPVFQRSIAS